ncbi:acyl-CoA-binding protein [Sediminicola luteus]|uniref:Acyl-CoA-binding protein n=1 Tax=Sediminicola luteus TaxID=319238 RepID=A0A2A4G6V5_9FLAO|nr:acyl-CoA-binding protein [Sediminicola luteus]PCE63472.1 acyl-CoA-binding protein [Sediminicola luteus]
MSKAGSTLRERFEEAVAFMNSYTHPLPADLLLKIYAYYKIANNNFDHPGSRKPLINAFKMNALIQAQEITEDQAMEMYIEVTDTVRNGTY